jgi:hypothetical protein
MDDDLLSAFVDDALNARERHLVIERLCRDPAWRSSYERYMLIGAVLRHESPLLKPGVLSAAVAAGLARTGRPDVHDRGLRGLPRGLMGQARRMPSRLSRDIMRSLRVRQHPARSVGAMLALLTLAVGVGYFGLYEVLDGRRSGGMVSMVSLENEGPDAGQGMIRPVASALPGRQLRSLDTGSEAPALQVASGGEGDYLILGDEGSMLEWRTLLDPNTMLVSYGGALAAGQVEAGGGRDGMPNGWSEGGEMAAPHVTTVEGSELSQ